MNKLILYVTATVIAVSCGTTPVAYVGERTDSLDDSAWEISEWISAADAPVITGKIDDENSRSAEGASWFVSTVKNEGKVVSAKWMTTGLGVYEIYLNGQVVGQEILKPGFTHYAKTKRAFTYDVTSVFKKAPGAENVLAAQLTPGWWADKVVTPGGHEGMTGKKCAFRGVLELGYADGSTKLYGTGTENWKAGIAGPVKHAGIFDGEEYDAREVPGFKCTGKLSTPEANTEFEGEILPTAGAEIYLREDLALTPVAAYIWKEVQGASEEAYGTVIKTMEYAPGKEMTVRPGETLVIDFGQNAAAVPSFDFKAKEGTLLTCLPGEILNDGNGGKDRGMDGPEGSVHRENLRDHLTGIRLDYTFARNKSFVNYTPKCTFFGYRYISVTASDEVRIRSVKSIPVTSITAEMETGKIHTGDSLVNRLISNIYWGQLSNYLSVPTDCPQRNERLGWTADTQVFTETGTYFADTDNFFHKWMRDLCDSQGELGGFPGVAPEAQYGEEKMRLGWADAGVIVPWTIWKQFSDTEIIKENWEAMEKYMGHIDETCYEHQKLVSENRGYQWADWLSYEALESHTDAVIGKNGPTAETVDYWNYLSACYWIIDSDMMRDMAAAIGEDASVYEVMSKRARAYTKDRFLNKNGTFKDEILNTMQTPALFALKTNIVEGEAMEAMVERLRKNFEEHENCLQTGFLGTSILMNTLTENGMSDIAYELLLQRKNPSWLYSVDNGATTIWERWNSYMADKGMGPKGMNSFNHYAYGCVGEWIWKTVAGIAADPAEPGFRHIIMKPIPDKRLGFVEAEYNSAAGPISSRWEYEGDNWKWTFSIPEGTRATVTLPGSPESEDYGPGIHTIEL